MVLFGLSLILVESTFPSEQRDASTRLNEDLRLRSELAARFAREALWKQELQAAKLETQQFSAEAVTWKNLTLSEVRSIQGEYHRATSELTEVTGHFLASKAMLSNFEQQASTWKEACRVVISHSKIMTAGTRTRSYP